MSVLNIAEFVWGVDDVIGGIMLVILGAAWVCWVAKEWWNDRRKG